MDTIPVHYEESARDIIDARCLQQWQDPEGFADDLRATLSSGLTGSALNRAIGDDASRHVHEFRHVGDEELDVYYAAYQSGDQRLDVNWTLEEEDDGQTLMLSVDLNGKRGFLDFRRPVLCKMVIMSLADCALRDAGYTALSVQPFVPVDVDNNANDLALPAIFTPNESLFVDTEAKMFDELRKVAGALEILQRDLRFQHNDLSFSNGFTPLNDFGYAFLTVNGKTISTRTNGANFNPASDLFILLCSSVKLLRRRGENFSNLVHFCLEALMEDPNVEYGIWGKSPEVIRQAAARSSVTTPQFVLRKLDERAERAERRAAEIEAEPVPEWQRGGATDYEFSRRTDWITPNVGRWERVRRDGEVEEVERTAAPLTAVRDFSRRRV